MLPESDVIVVEGTVAQRQVAVVRAEAQIERAADQLRALLNLPAGEWEQPLMPGGRPQLHPRRGARSNRRSSSAESYRPELGRVRIDLRRIALDLEVARNARLPRLDLRGAGGAVGQDERYGGALDQVVDATGRQWSVAVTLGWAPLGVGARAEMRRLRVGPAGQRRSAASSCWWACARRSARPCGPIDTAERQLFASAKFRDLAERSLDVEQRRFLNGLSSNFFVAQRQAELAQARLAELDALIQHERASSDLQLATGQLLEARRPEVRPARRLIRRNRSHLEAQRL